MTQKCSYTVQQYVWSTEERAFNPKSTITTIKHGAGSIMQWGFFAASGSGVLKKVNGKIKKGLSPSI